MPEEYVRVTNSESAARLWALEPKVRQLAETDPVFANEFVSNPLSTLRARFGEAAMPNEGEHVRPARDGGFALVFPKTNAMWTFSPPPSLAENGELSDELLEYASGGTPGSGIQGPSGNASS